MMKIKQRNNYFSKIIYSKTPQVNKNLRGFNMIS